MAVEAYQLGWQAGHRWALRGMSFRLATGALVGLVGPNGAGKSALLRLLAGLAAPAEGWVRVHGWETTRHAAAVRQRVGYLSERAGLYQRLTVAQNLDFVARAHGQGKAIREETVRTLLGVVELSDQAHALAGSLSPGQRRRAALAAALVHDPPVLLLDDPLRGLDGSARLEQTEVLRELRGMGKTVVMASNLLADLATLCDELVALRAGGIAWRGAPSDLALAVEEDGAQPPTVAAFDRALASLLESAPSA